MISSDIISAKPAASNKNGISRVHHSSCSVRNHFPASGVGALDIDCPPPDAERTLVERVLEHKCSISLHDLSIDRQQCVLAHIDEHIDMHRAVIAASWGGSITGPTKREVNRPSHLLIKQDVWLKRSMSRFIPIPTSPSRRAPASVCRRSVSVASFVVA